MYGDPALERGGVVHEAWPDPFNACAFPAVQFTVNPETAAKAAPKRRLLRKRAESGQPRLRDKVKTMLQGGK